jgi:hypothetical protein
VNFAPALASELMYGAWLLPKIELAFLFSKIAITTWSGRGTPFAAAAGCAVIVAETPTMPCVVMASAVRRANIRLIPEGQDIYCSLSPIGERSADPPP